MVILWLHHPVALLVDEADAIVAAQHGAQAIMEAVVINARCIRKGFLNGRVPLMVDEVEHTLTIDTSQSFREDPSFLVLRPYGYFARKAIKLASLSFLNVREANQTVTVRRLANPADVCRRALARGCVVEVGGAAAVIEDIGTDVLVAVIMEIG